MKSYFIYRLFKGSFDFMNLNPSFEVLKISQNGLIFIPTDELDDGECFLEEEVCSIRDYLNIPFLIEEVQSEFSSVTNAKKKMMAVIKGLMDNMK